MRCSLVGSFETVHHLDAPQSARDVGLGGGSGWWCTIRTLGVGVEGWKLFVCVCVCVCERVCAHIHHGPCEVVQIICVCNICPCTGPYCVHTHTHKNTHTTHNHTHPHPPRET